MPKTKIPPARSPRATRRAVSHPSPRRRKPNSTLVEDLTRRFSQDINSPELPLVVVNRVPQTRTIHAVVIWDRWKDVPIAERGRVIADAFAAAHPDAAHRVTFPMGLTPGEALQQGFLPYQIVPMVQPADHVKDDEVSRAIRSVGGVILRVGGDVQLRFATHDQAKETYRRLLSQINKPIWTISEVLSDSYSSDLP